MITDVIFDVAGAHGGSWRQALPFGLDAHLETPESAKARLDADSLGLGEARLRAGDYRQSFVLDKALVLQITWLPELKGIARVTVLRLGTELLDPDESA
ncbi:hypothetical protein ACQ86G_22840 [Roseateles chitinivorans]|uniref:hypothetical protein n=1 Tax=Roseateles chitinivorans TaxID=2917965 RepID=UPI003D677347